MSTATRLSATITCLSLSVLFIAQWLELIPDSRMGPLKARKAICEMLAIQCSVAAQRNDADAIRVLTCAVQERNPEIVYAAVRTADGKLLIQTGRSRRAAGADAEGKYAQVPIALSNRLWGHVEIEFEPLVAPGSGIVFSPEACLIGFMGSAGFLTYWSYASFVLWRNRRRADPVPERVRAALDSFSEGILVLDKNDLIAFANRAFASWIRQPAVDIQGRRASDFNWRAAGDTSKATDFPWTRSLAQGVPQKNSLLELTNEDGRTNLLSVNATPIHDDDGAILGALTTLDDQSLLQKKNSLLQRLLKRLKKSRDTIREQNRELHILATHDSLTKCLNRRALLAELKTHWSAACRYGHPLSCLMIDLDRFKSINDRHGHSMGDEVLVQVAASLKFQSRDSDFVCRYGGEEFCILLTHTDSAAAQQVAEKLRQAIAGLEFPQLTVTASIGVSSMGSGTNESQALLDQADAALYLSKESGRNRVTVWSEATGLGEPDLLEKQEIPMPLSGDD